MARRPVVELALGSSVTSGHDGLILISHSFDAIESVEQLKPLHAELKNQQTYGLLNRPSIVLHSQVEAKRVVWSPVNFSNDDFDDVRRYRQAGEAGISLALSAGIKNPALAVVPNPRHPNAALVAALGVLHKLHVPLNVRQEEPQKATKLNKIAVLPLDNANTDKFLRILDGLQSSFAVCRDVGDTDPIRMAPGPAAEYVQQHFKGTSIKVSVEEDVETIKKEYPLFAAVSRGCNHIEAHKARLITLEYENTEDSGKPFETLFLVGKGVTLDTGGLDVKTNGAMMGMSRDKYGSAIVAGFFDALDKMKPKGIKVVGVMCMVRNSIGSHAYSCDEIITSRSGKRILIGNTDAEGRLAMLDPLTKFKDAALTEKNPHIYTLATLTGHEVLSHGYFPSVIDNGVARAEGHAQTLQKIGDEWGQPVEISRLHFEDFEFNKSAIEAADLRQANNRPSVQTLRGHQTPCAFLISASGIEQHGTTSKNPIKYSHMDFGSAMGDYPDVTFPCPLLALSVKHIVSRLD